ncbi:MAG: LamG domain-containing protein, partial [Myxococcales bacterium]|nr:LamG domain-containing protein [Myxococcales bacterium]
TEGDRAGWRIQTTSAHLVEDPHVSIADLHLHAGDALQLTYVEDRDGDGLGAREERAHGTSDLDPDTDQDGLLDIEEIRHGWIEGFTGQHVLPDPLWVDTDDDGLDDAAEREAASHPWLADTDGDGRLDGEDPAPTVFDWTEVPMDHLAWWPLDGSLAAADGGPQLQTVDEQWALSGWEADHTGRVPGAIDFHWGTSHHEHYATASLTWGTKGAWSLAVWVRLDEQANPAALLHSDWERPGLFVQDGSVQIGLVDDAQGQQTTTALAQAALPSGTWAHVVATAEVDGTHTVYRLFVDGVQRDHSEVLGTFAAGDALTIGSGWSDVDLNALLGDVRVYDRALAPGEVFLLASDPG